MLTYRKDEILDLIASITKQLRAKKNSVSTVSRNNKKGQTPAELEKKQEKLENELTEIDEELFELEKKYGEYKRPAVVRKVVKRDEKPKVVKKEKDLKSSV